MANLPENTTYGSTKTTSPLSGFSSLLKNLQQKSQTATADMSKNNTIMETPTPSALPTFDQAKFESLYTPKGTQTAPTTQPGSTNVVFPTMQPLMEQTPGAGKTEPLPTGYSQFEKPQAGMPWVTPSSSAVARDWDAKQGGGQYIVDPTQPGKMIKSTRAIVDDKVNPGARKAILGNLPSSMFQVDHIVPLWAGGADTMQNLQIYDLKDHDRKTAIQAVPLTLLVNKKISEKAALAMALDWKNKDDSDLPSAEELKANNGYLKLDQAEKIAKKWTEGPSMWKFMGEAVRDFGKDTMPAPVSEFMKGVAGGATANILPGTEARPESGKLGAVANVAGNVLGMMTAIGPTMKLLGLGAKSTILGTKALTNLGKGKLITNAAAESVGVAKKVTPLIDYGAESISGIAGKKALSTIGKNIGVMSIWGQMGVTGRELTGQEEFELSNHTKQFMTDVVYGGLTSMWGQSLKGYAGVSSSITMLGLMEGKNIQDSLTDAAMMTGFHSLGARGGRFKAGGPKTIFGEYKVKAVDEQIHKQTAAVFNQYLGDVVPAVNRGEGVPATANLDIPALEKLRVEYQTKYPRATIFEGIGPITNQAEAVHFATQAAKKELGSLIVKSGNTIPQEQIKNELMRITTAGNHMGNLTLEPSARRAKEIADLQSMGEKLRPDNKAGIADTRLKPQISSGQFRPAADSPEALGKVRMVVAKESIPEHILNKGETLSLAEGSGASTGITAKQDPVSEANLDYAAKHPTEYDGKMYFTLDAESAKISRLINQENAWMKGTKDKNGKTITGEPPIDNPENTLRAFIKHNTKGYQPAGYFTQPIRLDPRERYNINQPFSGMVNRIRSVISAAKDPAELKTLLAKDQAKIVLTDEQATKLFSSKEELAKMSNEELISLLPAENALVKHTLDNEQVSNSMREAGLDTLIVDINNLWGIDGKRSTPYVDFKVTREDYLRSLASQEAAPKAIKQPSIAAPAPKAEISAPIERKMIAEPATMATEMETKIGDINNRIATLKTESGDRRIGTRREETRGTEDRRQNQRWYEKIDQMSTEEIFNKLFKSQTGLKNKLAYQEEKRSPYQTSIDVNGLKSVNDAFGHEAGDALLKKVGSALERASGEKIDAYHFSGDEFALEGATAKTLDDVVARAKQILKDEPLTLTKPDGTTFKHVADFSHGTATTMHEADLAMQKFKEANRTAATERGAKIFETPTAEVSPVATAEAVKTEKRPDPGLFAQTGRGKEGVNELALSLIKDPKKRVDYTRPSMTWLAKDVSNGGATREGVIEGWPKFLDVFTQKLQRDSENPSLSITDNSDLRKLKKLYTTLARSGSRQEVVINKEGTGLKQGGTQNVGNIDLITRDFNKREGLPEDSMEVIHVNADNKYAKNASDINFDQLTSSMEKMDDKKYLPVGITGKGIENSVFVKFEPKMVERFDKNPEKYLDEGETLSTPEDKFMRAYMVDVLGVDKNIKGGDFVKRANLVFHRYDTYHGPEIQTKLRILPAQKIGDIKEFGIDANRFENPTGPEAKSSVNSYHEGKVEDGPIYMGKNAFKEYIKGLGYNPAEHRGSVKALIDTTINGKKAYHKGQFTLVDDAIAAHLKETHGITVGPNDIISFDSNAKIGPKTGEFDLPLSNVFAKSRSTAKSISRTSPSGERKFLSTDPGVKAAKLEETRKNVKDLSDFNQEIEDSVGKAGLEAVLDKYADRFDINKEVLFQGGKQKAFELGAAKRNLSFELGKIQKNLLMDAVVTPQYKNSTMVTINAPIKAAYDGPNKPKRYVKDDEVVLGAEQLKALGVKEGELVAVHRDPSYDINNIVILKAVDGTKTGNTSLGKENGMVSPFNERMILQGDQDADTMHITKIGEGGISQAEVDAVKTRGKLATPFTEVNPTKSTTTTIESIKSTIKDQLVGDDQTSKISIQARIMDEVLDNKITIKVYPEADWKTKSKFEILANGKVVDTGLTANSKFGFTATPKWGLKERQLVSQAQREAVDSKKSKDIAIRTEKNPQWIIKQLWKVTDNMNDFKARSIEGALNSIQKPYTIKDMAEKARSINEIKKDLAPTVNYYNGLKRAGVELTPLQEKVLEVNNVKSFDTTDAITMSAHNKGGGVLKEKFGSKYNPNNLKVKELVILAKKAKDDFNRKGATKAEKDAARGLVENLFMENLDEGKYTKADLNNIAYWAATDGTANISWGAGYIKPKYVYLYKDLINASPEVAKTYYEGFESYSPDGTGGLYDNVVKATKKYDGQGGFMGDAWSAVKNLATGDTEPIRYNAADYQPTPPSDVPPVTQKGPIQRPGIMKALQAPAVATQRVTEPLVQSGNTYNIRGLKIADSELKEAANILYGEISNRNPDKQKFEIKNIVNTAINRAINNPKGFGSTLTGVLQKPYQYQSYAPLGMKVKGGKMVESQYQKVKAGNIDAAGQAKLKLIMDALEEIKTGKYDDTTGNKMFYVHASDGTMWLGKTGKEAKALANQHEKEIGAKKTRWGTAIGLPAKLLSKI